MPSRKYQSNQPWHPKVCDEQEMFSLEVHWELLEVYNGVASSNMNCTNCGNLKRLGNSTWHQELGSRKYVIRITT